MNIQEKTIKRNIEIIPGITVSCDLRLTKNQNGLVKAKLNVPTRATQEIVLVNTLNGYLNKNNTWSFTPDTAAGETIFKNAK